MNFIFSDSISFQMSQGFSQQQSAPIDVDEQHEESPEVPRRLVRSGKAPGGSSPEQDAQVQALRDSLFEALRDRDDPCLGSYFDCHDTDPHRRIALCRAYANYLAAQVGVQRRRSRVVKRIRYDADEVAPLWEGSP